MGDLHIPDEAREAATAAIHVADADSDWRFASADKSAAAALDAGAPLIVAAELRRLADWHFPPEPNSREGEAVCAVLNALRGRADELERGAR